MVAVILPPWALHAPFGRGHGPWCGDDEEPQAEPEAGQEATDPTPDDEPPTA